MKIHAYRQSARLKLSLLGVLASGFAAAGTLQHPFRFELRTDAKDRCYKSGDEAVVSVSVVDAKGRAVREGVVTARADDGWTNVVFRRDFDLAKEMPFRISLTRKTPGSIRVYLNGNGAHEKFDRLLFDWEKIRPMTPCPDDFEAYWRGELARLTREVPICVEKTPAPNLKMADHDAFYVSFATFNGGRIYGILAVPKDGTGPFPVIVNVPGAGPGLVSLNREIVRKGWITLMMNIHGIPLTGTRKEYMRRFDAWFDGFARKAGEPKYQQVGYSVSRESPLYHDTVLGMTRAIEWLSHESYVNPSRFVYYGCSQGGGYGIYLTAMWGKFSKTVALCPNNCDMLAYREGRTPGSLHIMIQKPENRAKAEQTAPYYDNCNFARMIHTPIRMMYGTADNNCNTVGGIAAFNNVSSKDKEIRLLPGVGHGWHKANIEHWLFN